MILTFSRVRGGSMRAVCRTTRPLFPVLVFFLCWLIAVRCCGRIRASQGCTKNVAAVSPDTPLISVLNIFVERNISALPIIDDTGKVIDIYVKYDAINLAETRTYNNLDIAVTKALKHRDQARRSLAVADSGPQGVQTCMLEDTLQDVLDKIFAADVTRLIIVDKVRRRSNRWHFFLFLWGGGVILDHFRRIFLRDAAVCAPCGMTCLGARADQLLIAIAVWNPMLCPIHAFRPPGSLASSRSRTSWPYFWPPHSGLSQKSARGRSTATGTLGS